MKATLYVCVDMFQKNYLNIYLLLKLFLNILNLYYPIIISIM